MLKVSINEMRLFFPDNSIVFVVFFFSDVSGRKERQIADFYSVFNEYSSPQSFRAGFSLLAILTQIIRFLAPPMMLSDPRAHTVYFKTFHFAYSDKVLISILSYMLHIPNSAEGNCLTGKENHSLCLKSDIKS